MSETSVRWCLHQTAKQGRTIVVGAVVTSIVVTGCSSDEGTGATTGPGVSSPGVSDSADTDTVPIVGTYAAELGPSGPDLDEPNPPGRWVLEVASVTEAYLADPSGIRFPPGNPVQISDGAIVFAADAECPTQSGAAGEGRYEWTLEGDILTLTEVSDTCRDRAFVLSTEPWTRTD